MDLPMEDLPQYGLAVRILILCTIALKLAATKHQECMLIIHRQIPELLITPLNQITGFLNSHTMLLKLFPWITTVFIRKVYDFCKLVNRFDTLQDFQEMYPQWNQNSYQANPYFTETMESDSPWIKDRGF